MAAAIRPRAKEQMKTTTYGVWKNAAWLAGAVSMLILFPAVMRAAGIEKRQVVINGNAAEDDDESSGNPSPKHKKIIIQSIEPDGSKGAGKEVAWLGVSTEEASEALASQLGLKAGEG